ncbi:MAG: dihydrolipoyllysine-residue acetyltransferase [Gammaproteobacteria bacterium]|nr:dihydrolipoyllysine-residue acetyltransferase [Gammaproteobacteria bacterium]
MAIKEVFVPDIGDVSGVDVIEILVQAGESVEKDGSLLTLESDKATMEVPAPFTGTVKEWKIKLGDKLSKGDLIALVEEAGESTAAAPVAAPAPIAAPAPVAAAPAPAPTVAAPVAVGVPELREVRVPDIGDAKGVDVIELAIKAGDVIAKDAPLMTLETDKATMEVPAPFAGTVKSVSLKVGDKVSMGDLIALVESVGAAVAPAAVAAPVPASVPAAASAPVPVASRPAPVADVAGMGERARGGLVHASPVIRRLAREFGVDLSKVKGTGPKGRILKEDVQSYVKFELSRPKATAASGGTGFSFPELPKIDFAKFGAVESKPLTRIQKISSVNLQRNAAMIPHVTQFDEADITELEAFRQSLKAEADKKGLKITPLIFLMKAVAKSLAAFPSFNASLAPDGENLILKKYFHIGVAVDTPDGLVVPVVRDVDRKSVFELAAELAEISVKAREKKLGADAMQGSCFTISSLGGIGGTAFTPIVNWPDVAILGVSKSAMKPVWDGSQFVPRLMLPLSLSYDHRVIDGAVAARFITHLNGILTDIRRVLL